MPSKPCQPGCTCGKHRLPGWEPSVRRMHYRLMGVKGKAREHVCVDCGEQARDWSQIHDTTGMDFEDYEPRCRSCHIAYDRDTSTRFNEDHIAKTKAANIGNTHAKGYRHTEEAKAKIVAALHDRWG